MYGISDGERRNLIRRCANPLLAFSLLMVVLDAVWRRVSNRVFRGHAVHYPAHLRRQVAGLGAAACDDALSWEGGGPDSGPRRLRLAVGYLEFEHEPDWRRGFEDEEQLVSLHRWNWLIRALTDGEEEVDAEWGFALVRSWLREMGALPDGPASESYTVGERLANLVLFSRIHGGSWRIIPDDLHCALRRMMEYLSLRVEYQPGRLTGNHVVNNARALLLAGHALDEPGHVAFARELLADQLPRLVGEEGFLREGSSHYQFLFTRWLVEMRLVAVEVGDAETLALLDPLLPVLVEACRFFLVADGRGGYHLPTIGDVSPDFDPEWLKALPWAVGGTTAEHGEPHGWGGLIRRHFSPEVVGVAAFDRGGDSWCCHPRGGWYRLDYAGWCAIWHAEGSAGPAIGSHAHHDLGSLVLFRHGAEVLIDPGRLNYEGGSAEGNYGVSAQAHNSVVIDGLAPMLSTRDRFVPARYRQASVTVSWGPVEGGQELRMEHDGFARLHGGAVLHQRRFLFSPEEVTIKDRLGGRGARRVGFQFHFAAPDAAEGAVTAGEDRLGPVGLELVDEPSGRAEGMECSHVRAGQLAGWRFPAYGVRAPAMTVRSSGAVTLPFQCSHVLKAMDRREAD